MRFHTIRDNIPKDQWFRLPEREHVKSDILKLNEGSWIETSRIIMRTGYYYQHHDMPVNELEERTKQHIMVSMNDRYVKIRPYDYDPNLFDERRINPWGTFTEEHYNVLQDVLLSTNDRIFKQIYYGIRAKWVHEQKRNANTDEKREKAWLRTFWYADLESSTSYQVIDYKNKQCGMYNAASGGYYGDDYDPAFVATSVVRQLYEIGEFNNNGHYEKVYVHPLDCEQDKEKYV